VSEAVFSSLSAALVDRERIESAMRAAVVTSDPYMTELASHLIVAGGKRLRPVLSVVAAQVDGRTAAEESVQGGVACELVHLGSLYHDDVMDEASTRRGVETVNAKWGNLQAILAGDFSAVASFGDCSLTRHGGGWSVGPHHWLAL
jgi:heptaprenyl diphosphate synthase